MPRADLRQAAICAGLAAAFFLASRLAKLRKNKIKVDEVEQSIDAIISEKKVIPLDIRCGLTSETTTRVTRWAFLSCGRVAHDFANALKTVKGAELQVVATREPSQLGRAEAFALAHGVTRAVGSYAEALADPEVDIVYLSAMHTERVKHVSAILEAGKHVLVEKPLACNAKDAKFLIDLAREKNCFLMEGMWTRFFPAVERARALLEAGVIGAVTSVFSDFGFDAADSGAYPTDPTDVRDGDPIYHTALGGGCLLWAGPYPLAAGIMPFGSTEPASFAAAGITDDRTGVDLSCSVTMTYAKPGGPTDVERQNGGCPPRGAIVTCAAAIDAESNETTTYIGTSGRITVLTPGHCPTRLLLEQKSAGRGAKALHTTFEYDLPAISPRAVAIRSNPAEFFYYPNSMGFAYEAAAVQRCLAAGLIEAPQYTNAECLRTLTNIDMAKAAMKRDSKEEA